MSRPEASMPAHEFSAIDPEGHTLEMDILKAVVRQRTMMLVEVGASDPVMYLNRGDAERLRDYLSEALDA